MRLNKYLALQLGISRREADIIIESSTVTINGKPAEIGNKVNENDQVAVAGSDIAKTVTAHQYLLLNKPTGYVCSRRSQGDNKTIYELLPAEYHKLKTVGRLDKDSSGLILLTNDGDFALRMTHPRYSKIKVYNVRLSRDLEPLHQQMISDFGVTLEDGQSQLSLSRMYDESRKEWVVTMSEGRNRQIRRTFEALGYSVKKLHRIQFGNYSLGDMKRGEYKPVNIQ
jgi:23S rRNA pseudouridine2605 synthase